MSKYDPLTDYLGRQKMPEIPLRFSEIEAIVGGSLPPSAHTHRAWWSNNPSNNVMTKAWLAAGYRTANVDLRQRTVTFQRACAAPAQTEPGESHSARHMNEFLALRQRLGLSQSELGQRLGVDQATVSRLETGKQVPTRAQRILLDRILAEPPAQPETSIAPPAINLKSGHHPILGRMKGTIRIEPGVDLTQPADPNWGATS
jgi:transcriptional regulator with XRE-family HTH domain